MATNCVISAGYSLGCFGTGGVKNVWIANYSGSATFTKDADEIVTATTDNNRYFKMEQDIEAASFNEVITNSLENGTNFFESTVGIKFFNNDATTRNLIKSLAVAPTRVMIEDNNGNYWFMGETTAVRVTEGTRGFGQALGDMNGASLTFTYKSSNPVLNVVNTALSGTLTPTKFWIQNYS
jgi:hypothetical protein